MSISSCPKSFSSFAEILRDPYAIFAENANKISFIARRRRAKKIALFKCISEGFAREMRAKGARKKKGTFQVYFRGFYEKIRAEGAKKNWVQKDENDKKNIFFSTKAIFILFVSDSSAIFILLLFSSSLFWQWVIFNLKGGGGLLTTNGRYSVTRYGDRDVLSGSKVLSFQPSMARSHEQCFVLSGIMHLDPDLKILHVSKTLKETLHRRTWLELKLLIAYNISPRDITAILTINSP